MHFDGIGTTAARLVAFAAVLMVAPFFTSAAQAQDVTTLAWQNHYYGNGGNSHWQFPMWQNPDWNGGGNNNNPPDNNNPPTTTTPPATDPGGSGSTTPVTTDPTGTGSTTPVTTDPSGSGSGSTILGGPPVANMVLTFDDEFNTLSASSSGQGTRWETKFWYNSLTHSNFVNLDLDPAVCGLGLTPYSLSNGILQIHEQTTDPRLTACGITNPYTSGNLYSYYSFSQEYGYFEIRAMTSGVTGTTFAFWMLPKDGSWPPEIDVTEQLGRQPLIDQVSNHTGSNNTTISFPVNTGQALAGQFHTYGVLWDPDTITYFLDGTPVARTATGDDEHKPFFLIFGLGAGTCGGWVGCPNDPQHFSADTFVDYVRAWQFSDQSPASCVGDCTAK